jgi:hypothetical protein
VGLLGATEVRQFPTTAAKREQDGHPAWDPEWLEGYFTCVLRCQRPKCEEITIATGLWQVKATGYEAALLSDDYSLMHSNFYRLQTTLPALPIMQVPKDCPEPIRKAIASAAGFLWADPGVAANRLRLAVEAILDVLDVPRTAQNSKGEDYSPSVNQRIEILRRSNLEVANLLEAVKWIGNQGSHEDSLSAVDVLDGVEILERALVWIYDHSSSEIYRRAISINTKNGNPTRNLPRS